jgi:hypothetical protein
MSTELKPTKDMNEETIHITQFWGGRNYGRCIQITGKNGYIVLNRSAAMDMAEAINEWIGGERAEAEEEEKS